MDDTSSSSGSQEGKWEWGGTCLFVCFLNVVLALLLNKGGFTNMKELATLVDPKHSVKFTDS